MVDIRMFDRYGEKRTDLSYSDYQPTDNAEPTGRLLSCDTKYFWADQEWSEPGIIGGLNCIAYYYFEEEEISDEELIPEDYPWDEEHLCLIIIDEDQD